MGFAKTLNNVCGLEYVLDNDNETGNNNIKFPDDVDPANTAMPVLKITNLTGAPTAVLPLAGELVYDSAGGAVYVHQGAGTWARLFDSAGDVPTLSEVLSTGNTTGNNSILFNQAVAPATNSGLLRLTGYNGAPTLNTGSQGELAFNEVASEVYVHEGAGVWTSLSGGGGGGDLASTLALGNTSGGNDISMTAGDNINFADELQITSTTSNSNVRVGYQPGVAVSTGQHNVLIGPNVATILSTGSRNVCIGRSSTVSSSSVTDAISMGQYSNASSQAISIGKSSQATGTNAIAIGVINTCSGTRAISLGMYSSSTGISSVAIGDNADATADTAIAIGDEVQSSAISAIAIGRSSNAYGSNSVSIGPVSFSGGASSIAIGSNASVNGINSVAIGASCSNAVNNSVKFAPSSNVFIDSTLKVSDTIIQNKSPSIDISDSNFTLSATQVLSNLMSVSGLTADRNVSFPTYATLSASVPDLKTYDSFIFYISNEDTTYNINLTSNTNCTFIGGSPRTIGPGRIATCLIYFLSTSYQVRFTSIESY